MSKPKNPKTFLKLQVLKSINDMSDTKPNRRMWLLVTFPDGNKGVFESRDRYNEAFPGSPQISESDTKQLRRLYPKGFERKGHKAEYVPAFPSKRGKKK